MKPYGNSSPHHPAPWRQYFSYRDVASPTLSAFDWLLILEPRLRSEGRKQRPASWRRPTPRTFSTDEPGTNPPDTSAIRDALSKMLILRGYPDG